MQKKFLGRRLLFYFAGLFIMTFGVVLSVKSDMGVTPISSIPYTMTVVAGIDLGLATIIFSIAVVILQILILRRDYRPINLLQIPVGIVFGAFLTLCGDIMAPIPNPDNYLVQFLLMLASTVFVALGVFLYVPANFVPLAPEGFILAVSTVSKKEFSVVKILSDISMVIISLVVCLVMVHSLGSVGIGTVVAALLVGTEVKWMTKHLQRVRSWIVEKSPPDKTAASDGVISEHS